METLKTMIIVRGAREVDKARSIEKVYDIFDGLKKLDNSLKIKWEKPVEYDEKKNLKVVLKYRKKTIGIESMIAPSPYHKECLKELADYDCDIIVCASNEGGKTYENIEYIVKEYKYYPVKVISHMIFEKDRKDEQLYEVWSRQIAEGIVGLIDGLINREHDSQDLQNGSGFIK
jgi:hypothetical protein